MAEQKLMIGSISLPAKMDQDLRIAIEDLIVRVDDTLKYLFKPQIVTVTNNYQATDLDSIILADASGGIFNVTLPDATTVNGKVITVKRISASNNVTVVGTIDGVSNYTLNSDNKYVKVVSNGTDWHVIGNN